LLQDGFDGAREFRRVKLTGKLGSDLRIASFSGQNRWRLTTSTRYARFLGSSRFIDQTANGCSGDSVLFRHFRQA